MIFDPIPKTERASFLYFDYATRKSKTGVEGAGFLFLFDEANLEVFGVEC